MVRTEVAQRLRVTYGVDGPLRYASVLDMGRLWERLLHRARAPLAYSAGFNPHPRLQFAAALPVGYSSSCELLDLFLAAPVAPFEFARAIVRQAPAGLTLLGVEEVLLKASAPQALMRAAHYRVRFATPATRAEVESALAGLLAQGSIVRSREKKGRQADYDLRPLIEEVRYVAADGGWHELAMFLRSGAGGSGRPEEVLAALGLPIEHYAIHRERLIWGGAGC
jgi:radical SAM-linked protein